VHSTCTTNKQMHTWMTVCYSLLYLSLLHVSVPTRHPQGALTTGFKCDIPVVLRIWSTWWVSGRVSAQLNFWWKNLNWVDDMFRPQCWAIIRSRRNPLYLHSFLLRYFFETWWWPSMGAETCRPPNKGFSTKNLVVLWLSHSPRWSHYRFVHTATWEKFPRIVSTI
jgi:hypothetical protein